MSNSNEKRSRQLGMPFGTATNKLRKQILFRLVQKCEMDICYQCNEKIENVSQLSIEHKMPWLDSDDPLTSFFDSQNIAFSHLSCNSAASRGYQAERKHPSLTYSANN